MHNILPERVELYQTQQDSRERPSSQRYNVSHSRPTPATPPAVSIVGSRCLVAASRALSQFRHCTRSKHEPACLRGRCSVPSGLLLVPTTPRHLRLSRCLRHRAPTDEVMRCWRFVNQRFGLDDSFTLVGHALRPRLGERRFQVQCWEKALEDLLSSHFTFSGARRQQHNTSCHSMAKQEPETRPPKQGSLSLWHNTSTIQPYRAELRQIFHLQLFFFKLPYDRP